MNYISFFNIYTTLQNCCHMQRVSKSLSPSKMIGKSIIELCWVASSFNIIHSVLLNIIQYYFVFLDFVSFVIFVSFYSQFCQFCRLLSHSK